MVWFTDRSRPPRTTTDDIVLVQQDVDGADAVGEHGDPGGVQVPGDELGGGAGINDHHRAVLDEFGGPATDRVLLLGELQVPLVDRQLRRTGQRDAAVGAGDVPALAQPAQVTAHRGERHPEPFGDLLDTQRAGLHCLQQLQDLLPAPRAAHIPAPRHQIGRGFVHGLRAGMVQLTGVIMFAHSD